MGKPSTLQRREQNKMKNKKWITLLLCLALCICGLCACEKNTDNGTSGEPQGDSPAKLGVKANVYGIVGPTGIGLVNLMKANDDGKSQLDYTFQLVTTPDLIVSKLTTGEADMAAIPTNLASTLYKKTSGGIQMIAINTGCVLYMVENGNTIQSIADLKGKTIYSTGEGSNVEYILRYVLKESGIDSDKDITLKFVAENDELAGLLVNGTAKIALVPEPLCTTVQTKNKDLRVALSINDVWNTLTNESEPLMGCVVATKAFINKHPDAVKAFLEEYEKSIKEAKENVENTAALCEQYGVIPAAAVAKNAIPRCQLTFISGEEMQKEIARYYQVLFEANPKSIGGALPEDEFYYKG